MDKNNRYSDQHPEHFSIQDTSVTAGFFETLLMNANVWITFLDKKGRIGVWNTAGEEITGYTEEEVRGSNEIWKKLYPEPEYRKIVTEKIDDAIKNRNKLENFETVILTKGGNRKQISWNTRDIRDNNGEIIGYIALARDISKIVSLEKKFRTLLMNANVWVAFLDSQTRIEVWNRAAEVISGYRAEEVRGSNEIWKKLYPDPTYRKEVTEKILDIISNKRDIKNFESKISARDGTEKIITWNTRALENGTGNTLGYIMIGNDITRERKLQADFIEYLGESAMRLKNPVEVIKSNMDDLILRLENGECSTEDVILQIRIQTKNAEQIIENLFELNKAIGMAFEDMPSELKKFLSE
ncbi:PAS domain-containing protein [Methanogenium organophilum]|uniref:PAS domain-containing protein n=1 Tax=Methanogenium organophilum TaxID=2199 RepID=A0A9X9S311_METOG|nr:PAS domain-containing protein [Methanogenium organophilum]WAI00606.1 PAS domain-containing protein [Methanogenium organophilum]